MSEVARAETPPKTGVLFAVLLAAFAAWILTLPVFPSQDGPMHRYYVHVLDSLLTHQHTYDVYRIRHPFPPYATHYFSLLALSHLFSFDLAEKLFVILVIGCLAYGLRLCATAMGPSGGVISLFVFPLLLGWTLMMGFMNYSLGVGLMFLAAGLWQRASAGASSLWFVFVPVICLLTLTHPIPLLILIALCALDLLLGFFWTPGSSLQEYGQRNRRRLTAVAFLCVAFLYPAASIDKSKSASTFAGFGIHPQQIAKNAALFGLSPYYTASLRPLINLYRLSLYLMLLGSLVLGALALREALRRRGGPQSEGGSGIETANLSQTLFLASILLGLSLTFLPDYVNGSGFFGTRMMSLVWLGALAAAAGYRALSGRTQRLLVYTAVLSAVISLTSAEVYFRPLARDLYAAEQEPLPPGQQGIVVQGPHIDDYARRVKQVAFDPYVWGPALTFVRTNDVILDSPWIDQTITPLQAVPGSPLLVDDIRLTQFSKTDPPFRPGASLPGSKEKRLVDASSVLMYSGDPQEIRSGLDEQLRPEESAKFKCSSHLWYMVCTAKP